MLYNFSAPGHLKLVDFDAAMQVPEPDEAGPFKIQCSATAVREQFFNQPIYDQLFTSYLQTLDIWISGRHN